VIHPRAKTGDEFPVATPSQRGGEDIPPEEMRGEEFRPISKIGLGVNEKTSK